MVRAKPEQPRRAAAGVPPDTAIRARAASHPALPAPTRAGYLCPMSPRRYTVDQSKGVLDVEWPLFGEMARALALKVARDYDPEIIVGIATSGVIPGAVIAAIHGREFRAMTISRRGDQEKVRETPHVLGSVPPQVRGKHVLIVDETCDSGDTLRLAVSACVNAGATEVRTAVCFKTGPYRPDFWALETESTIVLPWDREILVDDDLVPNPLYDDARKLLSPYR